MKVYDKNYVVLGATGTLGRATIKELLKRDDVCNITCLSRDELKQFEMRKEFNDDRLHFVLGDIRDKSSLEEHFHEHVEAVFLFAALKRIPEMEAQPLESLKTNVLGTVNAVECAFRARVKNFIFSSTDKACLPINTYGACKFLSEQIIFAMQKRNPATNFSVYRWGNIIASRGSIIPEFRRCIEDEKPVPLTDKNMSRFFLKIEDAVEFMLSTYKTEANFPKIPKMKSALMVDVIAAIAASAAFDGYSTNLVGLRPGEKLHEDIEYLRDVCDALSSKTAEKYTRDELLELVREAP